MRYSAFALTLALCLCAQSATAERNKHSIGTGIALSFPSLESSAGLGGLGVQGGLALGTIIGISGVGSYEYQVSDLTALRVAVDLAFRSFNEEADEELRTIRIGLKLGGIFFLIDRETVRVGPTVTGEVSYVRLSSITETSQTDADYLQLGVEAGLAVDVPLIENLHLRITSSVLRVEYATDLADQSVLSAGLALRPSLEVHLSW